jgi:small subunit ribosomal protein S20
MANTKSVQKRARQAVNRTLENRAVKTRVKSARKALSTAIEAGDKADASARYKELSSMADRAAKRGVIHKNSASRLKGIYNKRIAALG